MPARAVGFIPFAAENRHPGEGAELGKIVDTFVRAFEVHDLATRLARVEEVVK